MDSFQIFGLQVLLGFVIYGLIARWYLAPRLATLPLREALVPLLFLHTFRHLGLVFQVPTVAGVSLPPSFARPAAYGDLVAALLALLSIVALRGRWRATLSLVWLFNIWGTLDFANAYYHGYQFKVPLLLGSAWYIPTFLVPALIVTHVMMFTMLVKHPR
ncbi:MAG TPA: hypothetical protein VFW01_06645 [bacterium]|nr:hypothetical protein [bacterium]